MTGEVGDKVEASVGAMTEMEREVGKVPTRAGRGAGGGRLQPRPDGRR